MTRERDRGSGIRGQETGKRGSGEEAHRDRGQQSEEGRQEDGKGMVPCPRIKNGYLKQDLHRFIKP
jgi:hypothetical protein